MSAWLVEDWTWRVDVRKNSRESGISQSPLVRSETYYQTHKATARTNVMKNYREVQKLTDLFALRFSRVFPIAPSLVLDWQLWNWAKWLTVRYPIAIRGKFLKKPLNLVVSLGGRCILLHLKTTVKFYHSFQRPATLRAFKIKRVDTFDSSRHIVTNTTCRAIKLLELHRLGNERHLFKEFSGFCRTQSFKNNKNTSLWWKFVVCNLRTHLPFTPLTHGLMIT